MQREARNLDSGRDGMKATHFARVRWRAAPCTLGRMIHHLVVDILELPF